jgi:hypothetical protein
MKQNNILDAVIERYLIEDNNGVLLEQQDATEVKKLEEEIARMMNLLLSKIKSYSGELGKINDRIFKYDVDRREYKRFYEEVRQKTSSIISDIKLAKNKIEEAKKRGVELHKQFDKKLITQKGETNPEILKKITAEKNKIKKEIENIDKVIAAQFNVIKNKKDMLKEITDKEKFKTRFKDMQSRGITKQSLQFEKSQLKTKAKEEIGKILSQINQKKKLILQYKGKILTTAAVLAAVVTATTYVYKNYLSAAARSCKDKAGKEKSTCMKKYRIEALRAKLGVLRSSISKCQKADDPVVCKEKINDKIKAIENQINNLSKGIK